MRRIVAAIIVLSAVAPGSAAGALRLGPDLTNPPGPGFVAVGCQAAANLNPCEFVTYGSTNPDALAASPVAGVITSWSFRAGCCTDPQTVPHTITLRTFNLGVQTAGGHAYLVPAGTGPSFVIPPGNNVPGDPPVTLPARLPIHVGQRIGIDADYPISVVVYNPTANVSSTVLFDPAGFPEYMGERYGNPLTSTAMAINAMVEPDADGDGFGDETQDCQRGDPASHQACTPSPTPVQPPPVYIPGGKCEKNCGGGAVFAGPIPPPSGDGSKIYISLECPANATQPCGGFLLLDTFKPKRGVIRFRTLAKQSYVVDPGEQKRVKLKLSKTGRKLLQKKGKLKVEITIDPNEGDPVTVRKTLKVPRS